MTDATAGRGGVGIRLYTTGGEVVKRNFDGVGDSGKKMWAEIAMGERAANPAIRSLSILSGGARDKFDELGASTGTAGRALQAFGGVGVLAAAALGGLAIALVKVREGMQFAADLTDTSDRIGVGAEALQGWNYVADEAGVTTDKLHGVMEKLNGVVGAFKLGIGDGKLKPVFEELGITKAALADVESTDEMLVLLADTLGQVKDRATQVKLARSLGVEEALPILRLGSEAIRRMVGDAEDLGLVMSDDVRKGLDEADRAIEKAQQRINMSLRVAVSGLADDFANLVEVVADVIGWLEKLNGMSVKVSVDLPGRSLPALISDAARGRSAEEGNAARDEGLLRQPGWMTWLGFGSKRKRELEQARLASLQAGVSDIAGPAIAGGGFETRGHSSGGANSAAKQAEREAEQRRQREERFQDQLNRATGEFERTYDRSNMSIDDRAAYAIADLEQERIDRLREIAKSEEEYVRSNGLRGLTEAEAEQLRVAQDELIDRKKGITEWERRRSIAAERLRQDETAAAAAVEMLDIDAQLATTHRERIRIEREILLATIEIARKRKLAEVENDPNLTDDQRSRIMGDFNRASDRKVQLFDHNETERLREQFKSYGREVSEAIKDGRLGEYIGDRLKERLLDGALDALFNMLKGGGAGGGSGWASKAIAFAGSLFGGGRAGGGGTEAGRFYATAEHGRPELFMLGGQGQVTDAAATARMLRDSMGMTGGGATLVQQTLRFDNRGAVMTSDLLADMERQAAGARDTAFMGARQVVPSDMAEASRYSLRRGG